MGVIDNLVDQTFGKAKTGDDICYSSKISVVVPIGPYENDIDLLASVFDSIGKQDYTGPVETIAVCNGCPDYINSAAKDMADVHLSYKKGLGYSAARNKGIGKVKDSYITVLVDADTVLDDSSIFRKMSENIDSGYVGGNTNLVADEETCGESTFFGWSNMAGKMSSYLGNIPIIGNMIPSAGSGALIYYRSDLNARFDERLPSAEDADFMRQLRQYGKTKFISDSHVTTSGRNFRKKGPAMAWFDKFSDYIKHGNGCTEPATVPVVA
jgi:glycosyltransferase involved in cell wall biosynthesis